jgi:hypothetical protein
MVNGADLLAALFTDPTRILMPVDRRAAGLAQVVLEAPSPVRRTRRAVGTC